MINRRLKVLIIAHEFSPFKGSECAIGWNIITRLAKYHDITVLYASGSQDRYDTYINDVNEYTNKNGTIPGLTFVNIDQPGSTKFIASLNKHLKIFSPIGFPVLYFWGYKFWQKSALSRAIVLQKKEKFDIVHQLTQITFREPGYWWKLSIPFFWGPTGGLQTLPKKFYSSLSFKSRIVETIRTLSNFYQFKFSRRVLKANKTASVIYAFSNEDFNLLKKRAKKKVSLMIEGGTISYEKKYQGSDNSKEIKGIWCGQLIERKAGEILLKAIALSNLTKEKIKFQIVGTGPLEANLKKQSIILGLTNIEWIKNVDHDMIFELMEKADFFIHTSIREATSIVIMEALSTGLPVICHDAYGMGIAINETCGIKIPYISPEQSIKGFHMAMEKLVEDKKLLDTLKEGAIKRSIEISWNKKAEIMANDYTQVVAT